MPAGNDTGGKVGTDDTVHREHQRGGEAGKEQVGHLVMLPLAIAAAPAERKDAKRDLFKTRFGPVPHCGQIRHQSHVPEEQRYGEIGADRKDIPEQRTAEVRPHRHLVGQWKEPVNQPDAADMDARKNQCANHRKDGHRFCEPVDGGAPLLSQQEEDGRNQRAGMADPDPEDKVDNIPRPGNRNVVAPDSDAPGHQVADERQEHDGQAAAHRQGDIPGAGSFLFRSPLT